MEKEILPMNPKRLRKDAFNLKIAELIVMNESGTFNFDAEYQRDLVWTPEQK